MQVIERPPQRQRNPEGKAQTPAALRTTTLTALLQRHSSGYSREFMRESVMSWAAGEWPDLLIGRDACEPCFEAHSPSARVQVACAGEGEYVWSFKGTHADAVAEGVQETCVLVLGGREHDLLTVRTGHAGESTSALPCAQPRFLCSLLEHLPFDDGGYPVGTLPGKVFSVGAFANLREHLLSRRRTLPILAVAHEMHPELDSPRRPDPILLARALCGLVHVVSLGELGAAGLHDCLGPRMSVHAGEARLFMPGLETDADPDRHPVFAELHSTHSAESYVEAAAQSATHAWSTSVSRRADFEVLWARAGGA